MNASVYNAGEEGRYRTFLSVNPRYRVNDKLNFRLSTGLSNSYKDEGFVTTLEGEGESPEPIIFGQRDIQTVENVFNARYTFNANMALTFRMRHYWSQVEYLDFFEL